MSPRATSDPPARPGADRDPHGWRQEGMDLLRGLAAGSVVGMPLLYTMEMWWHGMMISPEHQLVLLGVMLLVNAVICYFSGFREEYSVAEAASESVSSVAMGLAFSLGILLLIREVSLDLAAAEIVGKVMIEAAPVSLGVTFANTHFRDKTRTGEEEEEQKGKAGEEDEKAPGTAGERGARGGRREDAEARQLKQDLKEIGATLSGAIIFAYNVAPTEEILLIATRMPAWQHLVVMAASLLLCYLILFASGFRKHEVHVDSLFQRPAMECVMAYALTLGVCMALLSLVGMPEVMSHPVTFVKSVVALGLVGVVGGAAGRLVT